MQPPSTSNLDNLTQTLQRYGLELPAEQTQQLEAYCALLWDWNSKLNLTRHVDYEQFVTRDVVDSLELARLLRHGEEALDVGSGGGVPGMVLAILRPDVQMSLCDSVGKKAKALSSMVQSLGLTTAVHACRAEDLLRDFRFDTLVARAVGPLDKVLSWFQPHWTSIGRLLAVKGPRWTEERAEAEANGRLRRLRLSCIASYPMPGRTSESVILEIAPNLDPQSS